MDLKFYSSPQPTRLARHFFRMSEYISRNKVHEASKIWQTISRDYEIYLRSNKGSTEKSMQKVENSSEKALISLCKKSGAAYIPTYNKIEAFNAFFSALSINRKVNNFLKDCTDSYYMKD